MDGKSLVDIQFILVLARYALLALGMLLLSVTILGVVAFWRAREGTDRSFTMLFERSSYLKVFTVLTVAMSAVLLALLGIIKENGIVAILSGVVGYVFGNLNLSEHSTRRG